MTSSYNRSYFFNFSELNEQQQAWIKNIYFEEDSDCYDNNYVILNSNKNEPLPTSMFMRTKHNNFTHGIYSTSAFDGYFITISRDGQEVVIAHKYF